MKMNRKEFLHISGKGIIGITFFNNLFHIKNSFSQGETTKSGESMIQVKTKRLNLAHTWTISRNSSDYKDNVFVKLEKDGIVGYGEAAPNVRYGENAELTTQRINEAKDIYKEIDLDHYINIKNALEKSQIKSNVQIEINPILSIE